MTRLTESQQTLFGENAVRSPHDDGSDGAWRPNGLTCSRLCLYVCACGGLNDVSLGRLQFKSLSTLDAPESYCSRAEGGLGNAGKPHQNHRVLALKGAAVAAVGTCPHRRGEA